MGDYFTLAHYQSQYIEALTATRRLEERLKLAQENMAYEMDPEAALERISALEAEYQAAKARSDDLWYKANTGQSREELGLDGGQPQRRRMELNKGWAK